MKSHNEAISTFDHPNPCIALGCAMQAGPLETYRDHRCPHCWTREGRKYRQRRKEKGRRGMGRVATMGSGRVQVGRSFGALFLSHTRFQIPFQIRPMPTRTQLPTNKTAMSPKPETACMHPATTKMIPTTISYMLESPLLQIYK
jgi:hypothetical protein